jgi:hypothetical protein
MNDVREATRGTVMGFTEVTGTGWLEVPVLGLAAGASFFRSLSFSSGYTEAMHALEVPGLVARRRSKGRPFGLGDIGGLGWKTETIYMR